MSPRPREPITITSALTSMASLMISRAANPKMVFLTSPCAFTPGLGEHLDAGRHGGVRLFRGLVFGQHAGLEPCLAFPQVKHPDLTLGQHGQVPGGEHRAAGGLRVVYGDQNPVIHGSCPFDDRPVNGKLVFLSARPLYSRITRKRQRPKQSRDFGPGRAGVVPFGLMIKDLSP